MYKLFLRTENGDDYLGEFASLPECQIVAEKELDYMKRTKGIKKAHFYALNYKGEKTVCWILGIKEEW